jgi:hypothetical protein
LKLLSFSDKNSKKHTRFWKWNQWFLCILNHDFSLLLKPSSSIDFEQIDDKAIAGLAIHILKCVHLYLMINERCLDILLVHLLLRDDMEP